MTRISHRRERIVEVFRRAARPLEPLPAGIVPRLHRLTGVRAVLFDIYGTLLVSASGDVGTEAAMGRADAIAQALAAIGLSLPVALGDVVRRQEETVLRHHAAAHARGIEFPEVDIAQVWQEVLSDLRPASPSADEPAVDPQLLAAEYEARVNPTWPMPGMVECLRQLRSRSIELGVISNAQFYTPQVFPALVDATLSELGLDDRLCFFSYGCGRAKPGLDLYEMAEAALEKMRIPPAKVLYVGNDMLKDILPAQQVGFRTALFAGDARSLRLREGDDRVAGVQPDLVVTELEQVCGVVGP